jgi:hypothetical protein
MYCGRLQLKRDCILQLNNEDATDSERTGATDYRLQTTVCPSDTLLSSTFPEIPLIWHWHVMRGVLPNNTL